MIKELIVVEGRDDITAVKQAVDAEVIAVHGFGITKESLELIRRASRQRGVIVLTDPDHAGETIRKRIEAFCPGVRHAYIMRDEGTKKGDVGVENANPQSILRALERAHATSLEARSEFTPGDLFEAGLMAGLHAKKRRQLLGKMLGIGYASASTLLQRLNNYGVSRSEYERAVAQILGGEDEEQIQSGQEKL